MEKQIGKRRTFAIISHPDAGKTTLTEKFLLYGGAIQLAGQVKAKGDSRRAKSDFMKLEKERGISVSASAMSFPYNNFWINLVDTPGHADFSEDTYRTITAVDSVVMVIDGAKGIESQTKKLFEVSRLREIPIITFCNKMDRESRDNFEIIDEIQELLTIDVTPASWPIGSGENFIGCYDLLNNRIELMDRSEKNIRSKSIKIDTLSDPQISDYIPKNLLELLVQEIEMVRGLLPEFNMEAFRTGNMTPIWFGSAINSFGVKELLNGITALAPQPSPRKANPRIIEANETSVSGFVFKVQANMDQKHRDRVAYVRLCSGHFKRGMKLKHIRSNKYLSISNPIMFMANDRELTEDAWAGDIIGIPNHGLIRLGDSFSEGEKIQFTGLPTFAPELLKTVISLDPMKAKHLEKALLQFAEEGMSKMLKPLIGNKWIIGVVGELQFDVLKSRIKEEYGLTVKFEPSQFTSARWLIGDANTIEQFAKDNRSQMATDHDQSPVYLIRIKWDIERVIRDYPSLTLASTKEMQHEEPS